MNQLLGLEVSFTLRSLHPRRQDAEDAGFLFYILARCSQYAHRYEPERSQFLLSFMRQGTACLPGHTISMYYSLQVTA